MSRRGWADLPRHPLILIYEKLKTHIDDILRLRSVCASWRSSIPPIRRSPLFPVKLPHVIKGRPIIIGVPNNYYKHSILSESTIYLLDPPASNSSPENSGSWLLRVEETSGRPTQFENPLSKRSDRKPPYGFPKVLNLLDFRVSELCRVHHVSFDPSSYSSANGILRVALSSRPCSSSDDYILLAVATDGQLCSIRLGGDYNWTIIQGYDGSIFSDVINFNGKFYAIDTNRWISVFEELSLQLIENFLPTMPAPQRFRDFRLVKSSGDLLLICRKLPPPGSLDFVHFRCFKLNQELRDLKRLTASVIKCCFLETNSHFLFRL